MPRRGKRAGSLASAGRGSITKTYPSRPLTTQHVARLVGELGWGGGGLGVKG